MDSIQIFRVVIIVMIQLLEVIFQNIDRYLLCGLS